MAAIKEYIKAIAAFGILITVFMAGFTISGGFWSSSNSALQNDLRRGREEMAQIRDELENMKLEYSHYRDLHPGQPSAPLQQATETKASSPPPPGEPSVGERQAKGSATPNYERLALRAGSSGTAGDGQLVISVVGIDRSHIDFVRRRADGSFRGIRLRYASCVLVETNTGDVKPKTLREAGVAHALPSPSALSPALEVEREILRGDYPELVETLNSTRTFSEAFSSRSHKPEKHDRWT
jgi:hypothetical protein